MDFDHQDAILGSKEQQQLQAANLIAKGKRTKRQRLHSPIPFSPIPTNSSSGEGGFLDHNDFVVVLQNPISNFSPSSSSTTTTKEEEDMANCLILLAQGRPPSSSSPSPSPPPPPKHLLDTTTTTTVGPFHHLNNRRYVESNVVAVGTEKGCYGYECKTCYRTFPSFQALGGHRASHKKPKANLEAEKKLLLSSDDEEHLQLIKNTTQSLSLQLNNNNQRGNFGKAAKVHECAICGAEFTSGQALGGHMRRHRAMPVGTNTALSLTPMAMETEDQRQPKRQRSVISLDLDLNLPAPQEHDQRESKFLVKSNQGQQQHNKQQQQQQQQQQPLVFPPRTLVDCHY